MRKKKFAGLAVLVALLVMVMCSGRSGAEEFGWPTPGITGLSTTYYYSDGSAHKCRYYYGGKAAGIDILAPYGTEVLAPAAGTVQSLANLGKESFGKYFEIRHDNGTITLYAHLSEFKVYDGQLVNRGDVIALSGSTGNSTGSHLHYEMSDRDTYQYYQTHGCNDPRYMDDNPTPTNAPVINQGLLLLNTSSYAKAFTLTSSRYQGLYSDMNLTQRLSSTAWTGENDEVYIIGTGWTNNNVPYARIKYPVNGERIEAYMKLQETFVPGTLNDARRADRSHYGLYNRKGGEGYSSLYGIDAGDMVYLLTEDGEWRQILYPISGGLWRIAWLSENDYNGLFSDLSSPGVDNTSARDKAVKHAQSIYDYTWTTSGKIYLHNKNGEYKTGTIRGIPYTLNSGQKSFEGYKALSESDRLKTTNGSMTYGMACAAFVTDCIRQGFLPSLNLPVDSLTLFHKRGDWNGHISSISSARLWQNFNGRSEWISEWNNDFKAKIEDNGYEAYKNLRKGDYLDNYNHVILVAGNDPDNQTISYIDQTPLWDSNNDVGTHKGTHNYAYLSSNYYVPMYVNYPEDTASLPVITTESLPDAYLGREYYAPIETSGTQPITYRYENATTYANGFLLDGNGPAGITTNGIINGTPVNPYAKTLPYTVDITITAENAAGSTSKTFTITVRSGATQTAPEILTDSLPDGFLNEPYSAFIKATGTEPIKYEISAVALANGLSCNYDTGEITGTVTDNLSRELPYMFTMKVTATNSAGSTTKSIPFTVRAKPEAPRIITEYLPDGYVGEPYYAVIEATGAKPITFSYNALAYGYGFLIDGNTPAFPSTNGILNGTPIAKSDGVSVKITATNEGGSVTKEFSVRVLERVTGPDVKIDSENFPDERFREYVKRFDVDEDGWLEASEIVQVKDISLSWSSIASLKGIEHFTALESLSCSENELTTLDLSNNTALTYLDCSYNQLTALDLSKNTALTKLYCYENQLTTLDLSKNTALQYLYCYGNQLTALDLSKNTALTTLDCSYNQLTALDLSNNTKLTELSHTSRPNVLRSTRKSDGFYYVDFNALATGGTGKIDEVKGYTGSRWSYSGPITPSEYNASTGIAKFAELPGYITYRYDTGRTNLEARYLQPELSCPASPVIVTGWLPDAIDSKAYSHDIEFTAEGEWMTWEITKGELPTGLSLAKIDYNEKARKITGTPKTYGTFTFTLKASNAYGSDTRELTLTVKPAAPAIKTAKTLPNVSRKQPYSVTLSASGTTPLTWEKTSGTLPEGLTLTAKGKLTGTPTKAGTYSFTVKASNVAGSASRTFTVKVTQTAVSGTIPATITRKASYTGTPKATGGASPYTWSISAGKLPDGLNINSKTGKISGTATKAGSFSFTVKAKDKNGAAGSKAYTVKVTQTAVKGDIPATITRKASYTGTPQASGGASPYTWSISAGKLPDGLKINASTGKITGTASKAGTFNFTVKAKDKNGAAGSKAYTVKVTQTAVKGDIPTTITRKASYTGTPKATGGAGAYTWSISAGKLPDGLKINASTGKITGTASKAGTFNFTVKAKDKNGAAGSKAYTVKVTQTAVKGDIPTTITRRASYTGTPKATGGAGAYTWSISAGKLPDGLKINSKTGKITGTATKAGTFSFTVKAKDKNGAAATKKFTVKVTQTKVTGTIPGVTKGSSYTATPKASGGASPYTWSISAGKLPNGLKINSKTGKITGTPTQAGTFKITVKAKDKNGAAGTKQYTLKVTASTTTKSATPYTKRETKNDAATSAHEHNTASALPVTPEPTPTPEDHTVAAHTPSIRVISDDILEAHEDRDNDIFTVKAGQPLTFILDGKISGAIVYIDDEPIEGITISDDGTFTLPAEFVSGDFKVQVKSSDGKIESQEAFIISE